MPTALVKAGRTWINHPSVDYATAALALGVAITARTQGWHPLADVDPGSRLTWLQTLTGLMLGALALEGGAMAVVYAVTPGPRLKKAFGEIGHELTRLLMAGVVTAAVGSAVFGLAGPSFQDGPAPTTSLVLLVVGVLVVLSAARFLWLFYAILRVFARDAEDQAAEDRVPQDPEAWDSPDFSEGYEQVTSRRRSRRAVRSA